MDGDVAVAEVGLIIIADVGSWRLPVPASRERERAREGEQGVPLPLARP